ncbi:hypothetical protein [Mycoplasma sp. OR1901]|uniref:hypothetical protein n=1 Tax=Mycoplasma sp. OR1901 TaxID=2742195 RepID=UPI001582F377|nr:hypothetical protein [Mycoplasma sp. OR1901]QKT05147.1 hypothetical protein HTZ87_00225 [Mycoplasma sp. OR1901]
MGIKEKIENSDLRLSSLSKALNISRPTLYKFIDLYDRKKTTKINAKVKELLKFIDENEYISNYYVMNYISVLNDKYNNKKLLMFELNKKDKMFKLKKKLIELTINLDDINFEEAKKEINILLNRKEF